MEIIPVIDLKDGVVVRARQGDRANYRPIETPLSAGSGAVEVVAGLLSLHPFRCLYVADLDAIEGRGNNNVELDIVAQEFPGLSLWIDNGCSALGAAQRLLDLYPRASLVLGSESQRDAHLVSTLRAHPRIILSLDFRGEAFLGPEALLHDETLWPDRLILMTLARVGSDAGPDLAAYRQIRARGGQRKIYLAGGMRGRDDLATLQASGAAGILVASALHDGRLTAADLAAASVEPDAPDRPQ